MFENARARLEVDARLPFESARAVSRTLILLAAWALATTACVDEPALPRLFCFEDGNCGSGESCVADLTNGVSYCAGTCKRDVECPSHQQCQLGTPARATDPELSICVDRVRECVETERCNGLDDDCDGVIDGPGCTPITGCLDDLPCGGFVCSAPINQPLALCVPPNPPARADYETCTVDTDCDNGVCQTGRCAPFCRPESTGVRVCPTGRVCARGVGPTLRPEFNQCQAPCAYDGECADAQDRCVWRSVYQDSEDHHSVCAKPDGARKPVGVACTNNTPAGDDECQSGLCFGQQCTRFCAGSGTDCSDVSPTAFCCRTQLRYGAVEFARYMCVEPGTPCG